MLMVQATANPFSVILRRAAESTGSYTLPKIVLEEASKSGR